MFHTMPDCCNIFLAAIITFSFSLWKWMKFESITWHLRLITNQNDGLKKKNRVQWRAKIGRSLGKVIALGFWDTGGTIFIHCLKIGKSINAEYCANFTKKNRIWLRLNYCVTKTMHQLTKTNKWKFEFIVHTPYSPDLALSNFVCSQQANGYF